MAINNKKGKIMAVRFAVRLSLLGTEPKPKAMIFTRRQLTIY
jgi:hypothetical protein